jgi:hypothetical protein
MDQELYRYLHHYYYALWTDPEKAALSVIGSGERVLSRLRFQRPSAFPDRFQRAEDVRRWLYQKPLEAVEWLSIMDESMIEDLRLEDSLDNLKNAMSVSGVREKLAAGFEAFQQSVVDRISREHPDLPIHRCPECNTALRTPLAKQCLKCGHDWH